MASSFSEFKEQVRARTDIVEAIGRVVELKRAGARLKGLCPFHQEKSPSFTVDPQRQSFYCFGCHAHGDVFNFVERSENLDFMDALAELARRAGMEMPRFTGAAEDDEARKRREALLALNALARNKFREWLNDPAQGAEARAYLDARQLNAEIQERFQIGYAPAGWDSMMNAARAAGFSTEAVVASGLGIHNEERDRDYDRFRGRIMFPISDSVGRPIAFGGRVFGEAAQDPNAAKYINSPETPLYTKGETLYAYHLARDTAREKGFVFLLEGYTDVIAMHVHGFTNAVASLGTALTASQARLLRRLCPEAVFLYDDDEPGRNAMWRGTEVLLAAGMGVKCMALAEGEDPDSFLRANGAAAFAEKAGRALPYFDFFLAAARRRHDLSTVEGRTATVEMFRPIIRAIVNPIEQEDRITRLAEGLGVSLPAIKASLGMGRGTEPKGGGAGGAAQAKAGIAEAAAPNLPKRAELAILRILIEHPAAAGLLTHADAASGGSEFDPLWLDSAQVRWWVGRVMEHYAENGPALWESMLEWARDDADRAFLRRTAMDDFGIADLSFPEPGPALANAVNMVKINYLKAQSRMRSEAIRKSPDAGSAALDAQAEQLLALGRRRLDVQRDLGGMPAPESDWTDPPQT